MGRNEFTNLNKEKQLKAFIRQLYEMRKGLHDARTFKKNKDLLGKDGICYLSNCIYYLNRTENILKSKYESLYGECKDYPL